jgi:hypothetical protein
VLKEFKINTSSYHYGCASLVAGDFDTTARRTTERMEALALGPSSGLIKQSTKQPTQQSNSTEPTYH